MSYDDDEVETPANSDREFICPACKTSFKMKVREITGLKTVKCVNTTCGQEISLEIKYDPMSQFDRAMSQLDKTMDKLSDFKFDF